MNPKPHPHVCSSNELCLLTTPRMTFASLTASSLLPPPLTIPIRDSKILDTVMTSVGNSSHVVKLYPFVQPSTFFSSSDKVEPFFSQL
jgi:hypothetical protein